MSDLTLYDPNFKKVTYKQEDVKKIKELWADLKKEIEDTSTIVELITLETPYSKGQIALLLWDQHQKGLM